MAKEKVDGGDAVQSKFHVWYTDSSVLVSKAWRISSEMFDYPGRFELAR